MKQKKIISLFASAAMILALLTACGGSGDTVVGSSNNDTADNTPSPPDLTGEWKQVNSDSDDSYQSATISGDTIEIYWVSEEDESKSLYWAGTFIAPETAEEPYSWDSENDHERTDSALLASTSDTKTFTYENGEISYEASALGTTTTIRLEKTGEVSESTDPAEDSTAVSAEEGDLGDYYIKILDAETGLEDYEGTPVIVIRYEYTNNSEENMMFDLAVNAQAFQDGVQLDLALVDEYSEEYENSSKEIKTGTTITCEVYYELTSESDVEIEVSELISLSNKKLEKTFAVAS